MSDIKLFRLQNEGVEELPGQSVAVEKSLQQLIEKYSETFLGIRFLRSEYQTGKKHGGRIDTLGIDENGYPVIIEYKRSLNENVINQGLFYLDWLLDHKAEFYVLVMKQLGKEIAETIEWSNPRLLCIAGDFTKYDCHAVQQINRNIELLRYRSYSDDILLLELVNTPSGESESTASVSVDGKKSNGKSKTPNELLEKASTKLRDRFETLKAFLIALGDDVQFKSLACYFAFKRIKNFACVEIHPTAGELVVFVKVNPDSIALESGFTRDVRQIGHFGTGDLEIRIRSDEDLKRAEPLILQSYEIS